MPCGGSAPDLADAVPDIIKVNNMNRFYLSTRLKIYVTVFVALNFLTAFSMLLVGDYHHWIWLFPMSCIARDNLSSHENAIQCHEADR
jgi:hypothetical protein